jgi:LysM repeat protein
VSAEWRSARIAALMASLERHRNNIAKLEERRAKYGLNVPLELENELADEQAKARGVEAQLQHLTVGGEDPLDRLFRKATRARIAGQVGRALQFYEQIQREDPTYPDIAVHVMMTKQELGRGYIDNGGRVIRARVPRWSIAGAIAGAIMILCAASVVIVPYAARYLFSPAAFVGISSPTAIVVIPTPTRTHVISTPSPTSAIPTDTPVPPWTPPHTPTPTTPPGTPGALVYHTVRYGETLFSIGRLYGVNPYAIARANGLANPNRIYAGQMLLIPQGGDTTPSPEPTDTPTPTTVPTEVVISAEQAIRDYYSLIIQKQYAVAWEMLSDEFNARMGITTLDKYISGWEESGPATIVEIEVVESNGRATITLMLYYPKKDVYHKIRCELMRDIEHGNHRFGYWLFESSKLLW